MDHHEGSRGSGQAPAKDFLALTHGQEWVNFYESFDKLVQDHLSRSSELLRRAMSLPEVADREVAQVRAEMEGKLAAERERSHDLLTKLRDEISFSHANVASVAESVQTVAGELADLKARVVEALASLDLPLSAPPAESPAPMPAIEAAAPSAPAFNGVADPIETFPQDLAPAASFGDAAEEVQAEAVAEAEPAAEAEEWAAEPAEPSVPAWPSAAFDEPSDSSVRFDAETGLDLTALAEAETVAGEEASEEELRQPPGRVCSKANRSRPVPIARAHTGCQ